MQLNTYAGEPNPLPIPKLPYDIESEKTPN